MGHRKTFSRFFYLLLPRARLGSLEDAAGAKIGEKKLGIGNLSPFPELPGGQDPALGARQELPQCLHSQGVRFLNPWAA